PMSLHGSRHVGAWLASAACAATTAGTTSASTASERNSPVGIESVFIVSPAKTVARPREACQRAAPSVPLNCALRDSQELHQVRRLPHGVSHELHHRGR